MESSYYVVEPDDTVNLSSNLVMENGVKTSQAEVTTGLKSGRFHFVSSHCAKFWTRLQGDKRKK